MSQIPINASKCCKTDDVIHSFLEDLKVDEQGFITIFFLIPRKEYCQFWSNFQHESKISDLKKTAEPLK